MKTGILVILSLIGVASQAQTVVDKSIPVPAGQKIILYFDYPNLIRITTWDKDQVSIQGTVSINGGEHDDAFQLVSSTADNTVSVRNEIRDMENIPRRITITDGLQKIIFQNDEEYKKYQQEHGKHFNQMSRGIDIEIRLEIKVPRNVETHIESKYGMVEVKDFAGPLTVEAMYGGVDAALNETATGDLSAETNFGEIYTNFNTKFGGKATEQRDFHTFVSAKPGTGPSYTFISKYGNVYIRKAK